MASSATPPGDLDDAALRAKFDDAMAQARRADVDALWEGLVVRPGRLVTSLQAACRTA